MDSTKAYILQTITILRNRIFAQIVIVETKGIILWSAQWSNYQNIAAFCGSYK